MIYEHLPGAMIYADFAPGSWLLHFAKVPWPLWASANEVRRLSAFDWGLQWYWWRKHAALLQPCKGLHVWLERVIEPEHSYGPAELLRLLISAGCPFDEIEDERYGERLLLMPQWNGWIGPVSGKDYLLGHEHETRPMPQGLPRFLGQEGDAFVNHSHFAQLLRFLEWQEKYTLDELQILVRRIYAGQGLCQMLERVAATWSDCGSLQAAQWVLGLHLELAHSANHHS